MDCTLNTPIARARLTTRSMSPDGIRARLGFAAVTVQPCRCGR